MFKILVNVQKNNYGEIVPLKVPGGLKSQQTLTGLVIFSSTVRLRKVILALWTLKRVSASAYEPEVSTYGEVKNVEC